MQRLLVELPFSLSNFARRGMSCRACNGVDGQPTTVEVGLSTLAELAIKAPCFR